MSYVMKATIPTDCSELDFFYPENFSETMFNINSISDTPWISDNVVELFSLSVIIVLNEWKSTQIILFL